MRRCFVLVALLACGCTSTSPNAPTELTASGLIAASTCPTAVAGVDLAFYQEIGCNTFDGPRQSVRRWTAAPAVYVRTVDEAGTAVDAATLETVTNTIDTLAPALSAGKLSITVERGPSTREGQAGWITVKFPAATVADGDCGRAQVAVDGGWIEIDYKAPRCLWSGAVSPYTVGHELGHALGYWHTDDPRDLMAAGVGGLFYNAVPSPRELQAVAFHYR